VRIERVIEGALAAGLLLSGASLVLGLATATADLLRAGIVLLMLTPVARVVVLTIGLSRQRDWLFATISLFVLAVLGSGIALAFRP
jgi:uncharacterized membrane protein